MKLADYLQKYRVFLFVGNGGTGKTTLSATWALELASRGKKVGLMTIDPARRLGEAFGMNLETDDYKRHVVGDVYVDVHLIHSQKMIRDFIVSKFGEEKYKKWNENSLFHQVVTRLAENQSLSTIYKLAQILRSEEYDYVVVDTPPVNHAADFFRSPQRVLKLFKENLLAKTVLEGTSFSSRASQKIFSTVIGVLAGGEFVRQMENFFAAFFSLQSEIVEAAEYLAQRLKNPQVCYFLVVSPEPQKLQETDDVLADFKQQGISAPHVIVNRAYPDWLSAQKITGLETWPLLQNFYDKVFNYYHNQMKRVEEKLQRDQREVPVYFLPETSAHTSEVQLADMQKILNEVFL